MQSENNYLMHHGIKGQKWGVRNYQNEDGTLTLAGKERYQKKVNAMFGEVRGILRKTKKKAVTGVKNAASKAVNSFADKHKPVSQMSDSELRERLNRLNMERQYKQVKDDLSGKNRSKRGFGDKHPLLKQMFISTAVTAVSNLVSDQLRVKADEMLGQKRLDRAKNKNMLDQNLIPFVSKPTAGRISAYQTTEKGSKDLQKKIDDAVAAAKKTFKQTYKLSATQSHAHGVKAKKMGKRTREAATTLVNKLKPLKMKDVRKLHYDPARNRKVARANLDLMEKALKNMSSNS